MFCAVCTTELRGLQKYCHRNIALEALHVLYNCWEFVGPGHNEAGNGYFNMRLDDGFFSMYLDDGFLAGQ